MNQPIVSIITPSYNQAAFLEQTIQSVLTQDYEKIEYIIIDGGSTDGSVDIIQQYSNKIAYWISESDLGQSHAINKGLSIAKGEFVAWLNSDDLYTPHSIAEAVKCLQDHPQAGMVYSNCIEVNREGEILAVVNVRQFDLVDLLSFNIIPQPTVILRRDIVMYLGGLNESMHLLFDHDMWVRVASIMPIQYESKLWAVSRIHNESKNSRLWSKFGQEASDMIDYNISNPLLNQVIENNKRQIRAGISYFSGNYALVNGDFRDSAKEFIHAILLYPRILNKMWKQVILLILFTLRLVHPGEEFNILRRRFRSVGLPNGKAIRILNRYLGN